MPYIDDTNTTVSDWLVSCYESEYFGIVLIVLGLMALILVGIACRLYFQTKEAQGMLDEYEKE